MRRLSFAVVVLCVVSAVASAAPVMPSMPNIAYLFDTISAGTTPGFVSGTPNGTLNNGPTLSTNVPIAYTGNKSMSFDGSDDYIDVVNHSSFNGITGEITIAFWAQADSSAEYGLIVAKTTGASGAPRDFAFGFNAGTDTNMLFHSTPVGVINSGYGKDTAWHHWAVTRSGSTWTFYKDGVANVLTGYAGALPDTEVPLLIGCAHLWLSGAYCFDGLLDEVGIWDEALSADEIDWLRANSISTIPEPATLAFMGMGLAAVFALRKKR